MGKDQLLPTPQSRDWKGPQGRAYKGISHDLPSVAMGLNKKGQNQRNPSTEGEQLTFSQEASHANLSPLPGSEKAKAMTVTSGQKCLELYRKQSPVGLLVRMCLESSIWDSKLRFLTWKEKVTKWNFSYFQLAVSAVGTKGTGSGLWHTPNAADGTVGAIMPKNVKISKSGVVRKIDNSGKSRGLGLTREVQMYPTPTQRDYKGQNSMKHIMEKPRHNTQLPNALRKKGIVGQLNPNWVTWLMGYPPNWVNLE